METYGVEPAQVDRAQDLAGVPVADHAHPLREQIDSSANWFYRVAGLSLVNVAVALAGSNWAFAIGLGLPQLFMALAANTAGGGALAPHVLVLWAWHLAVPGFFLACGWFARYPSLTAFVAGTVVFAIDSLVFVPAADRIGIAFRALVLYFLWKGILAVKQLRKSVSAHKS